MTDQVVDDLIVAKVRNIIQPLIEPPPAPPIENYQFQDGVNYEFQDGTNYDFN